MGPLTMKMRSQTGSHLLAVPRAKHMKRLPANVHTKRQPWTTFTTISWITEEPSGIKTKRSPHSPAYTAKRSGDFIAAAWGGVYGHYRQRGVCIMGTKR